MKLIAKSVMGALLLVSTSAMAGTIIVPPASGHYYPETGLIQENAFAVFDNTVCGKLPSDRYWNTPIVMQDMTGGVVDVYAKRSTGSTSTSKSNAYSVDETGNMYEWTGSKTNNAFLGDVTVPTNGTLFAEAMLSDSLDDIAGCIYQYRAEW